MDAQVLLYLPKDSVVADLLPGQKVRFYGKIETPKNLSPEFDYVRYLHHRHVNGTLYTRRWQLVDSAVMGWKAKALLLRERLREYYAQAGMEGDEGAVLFSQCRYKSRGEGRVIQPEACPRRDVLRGNGGQPAIQACIADG